MRAVVEAAGDRDVDTTDGVRVVEDDGRWALVLPDPAEAVTHLWAEADGRRRGAACSTSGRRRGDRAGQVPTAGRAAPRLAARPPPILHSAAAGRH